MNKKFLPLLIVADLIWAGLAVNYDYPVIRETPLYYWPFLIICPIYPLLLALVWNQVYRQKRVASSLLALAMIPSVVYFIGALIYYPVWMMLNGFDWLTLGAIFWVAFYGLQAVYLSRKFRLTKMSIVMVGAFITFSLAIQSMTKTLEFLDFTNFSDELFFEVYLVLFILSDWYLEALYKKSSNNMV